jgi:hypothetical protein
MTIEKYFVKSKEKSSLRDYIPQLIWITVYLVYKNEEEFEQQVAI